jgi:outer membrane protein TolC
MRGIISLVSAGLLAVPAIKAEESAEATNAVVITTAYIDSLVEEARTNNPALKSVASLARAATLNAEAVRTWDDPMAMFGGSVFSSRGFDPAEEGDLAYGVEQKLPLWGRPKLSRRVAEAEGAARQAEAGLRLCELRRDVTKGLLTTALAESVVEIGEQDLAWLGVTARAVESRYRSGDAALADTLQIQNEAAERNDELQTDRHRLTHEWFALNRLLNRSAEARWPTLELPPVGPAIPLSRKLVALALQSEPRLKVMEQEVKQMEAAAELTRNARLPDVSLGVEGRQYSGDGGFREGDFTLRFSLPWINGDKYRKDYERDKEKQRSAEEEREDRVLMVREELHHLSVDLEAARREALLYSGEITTRAEQALKSRLADWETGRGTFRDVLDARRMLLDSELKSAQATTEANEMFAEMLLWTGLESNEDLLPLANEAPLPGDHIH